MNVKSFLLVGSAVVSLAATADVDLKNAVIVHPENMVGWETPAVEDMKTALEKMTGRDYRVFPEGKAPPSGVKIYIGNTRAAQAEGIDPEKMETQEFRMKAGNGKVFLVGGSPIGTSYGVSTFLQTQFGVYCLAADCFVYPKNSDPKVKDLDKTQKPDITIRSIGSLLDRSFEPETQKKWSVFHRINRRSRSADVLVRPPLRLNRTLGRCHSFFKIVPPKKYFKAHPEYYSMRNNGQRDWKARGNLCLSNREVWDVALKELLALIKADRKKKTDCPPTIYTVAPEDGTDVFLCHCPECKKRTEEEGSYFVLIADFVNYLAREVRKSHPDIRIMTAVNGRNDNPEAEFTLEKNVIFFHADRSPLSSYIYPLTDPMNRKGYKHLMEWRRKSPVLWFWDYWWMPCTDQPVVAVDAIIGDCRLLRDLKVESIHKETEFLFHRGTYLSFHLLQVFLDLQLLFDASQDPEKLINVFMDGYYGAAAPEMKEYLALLRKAQKEKRTTPEEWAKAENRRLAHISREFLDQAYALVKRGLEKVRDDRQLTCRVSWELINIARGSLRYYRNDPVKYRQLREEYKAAVLMNLDLWRLRPEKDAAARAHLAAEFSTEGVKYPDLPPELASLPADRLVAVPFKYLKGHAPANVCRVADPESSQPYALVKKPIGAKTGKLLPFRAAVYCLSSREKEIVQMIKKAPADEKYHWYRIGVISLEPDFYINVNGARLLLKDFYTAAPGKDGKDPNKYEVWVSVRMQGPGYVPGSTKENGMYLDRGLLVRKP